MKGHAGQEVYEIAQGEQKILSLFLWMVTELVWIDLNLNYILFLLFHCCLMYH